MTALPKTSNTSATEATLKGRMRPTAGMTDTLLAIDDPEAVLRWAIEFKRLWKSGDEVVLNFMPLDTSPWDASTRS